MTEAEYRRHPAVSRSELWKLHESPEKFRYYQEHPEEPTPALLLGQVFHKLALEPETFHKEFAVAPEVDRRTRDGKLQWEAYLEDTQGKASIPADMMAQAQAMREALYAVPFARKLLDGPRELPFFWTDTQTGEGCKCRVDCLNTRYSRPIIVDLKSAADAGTDSFTRDAIRYGYDFQAAMYQEGVERNIRQRPTFVFIVVEKDPPYAVNILQADELLLRRGRTLYREFLDIYHDCKTTGNWYGYLGKHNQINNLALPSWLAKEIT